MNTRKLFSEINYALNSIAYSEEERKDIKKSVKRLKEEIKLINHYKREYNNLTDERNYLKILYIEQKKVLNIFKDYFSICDDKTSFDTFLTSNYSYHEVELIKRFFDIQPERLFRNFELIIFKEQFTDELLSKIKEFKNYAYILHDKDLDTPSHYHILISDFNSYTISNICALFGIDSKYINVLKQPIKYHLNYLVHDCPTLIHKYQYDRSKIINNF